MDTTRPLIGMFSMSTGTSFIRSFVRIISVAMLVVISVTTPAAPPGSRTDDSEAMKKLYTSYGVASATLAGDYLFIGGLTAFNDDGSVYAPLDGKRQMEKIVSRLQKILSKHDANANHIVKVNSFVTDWDEFNKGYPLLVAWFDKEGAEYASGTAVGVTSLAAAGLIVEMDFVAYLGE